ncbi:sterol desaturase/sphingolipid hydroxylase (fatty acid hydroxylase superfamily) [Pseudomonas frederiksbergensis]
MDVLSLIYNYLTELVIEPVTDQFFGIFDLNGRLGVLFLFTSYSIAYSLFRFRKHRGLTDAHSFGQFIGGSRVNFHRSALLDYRYYFVRAILKVALVLPIVGLVDPYILRTGDYIAFFTNLWGARPQLSENLSLSLLYGLGVFLVKDFTHYWAHRAFHSRWLWAFHKVHHSAPVLVPATASRVHFVEKIVEKLTSAVCLSAYAGVFWYACGGEISRYTLFGVTYLVFILNGFAANLRHSHVWLSFGPVFEHVLNSPAQHQIHHSDAPPTFQQELRYQPVTLGLDVRYALCHHLEARAHPVRHRGTGSRPLPDDLQPDRHSLCGNSPQDRPGETPADGSARSFRNALFVMRDPVTQLIGAARCIQQPAADPLAGTSSE